MEDQKPVWKRGEVDALEVYELLRVAHDRIKWVGGDMSLDGKVNWRNSMLGELGMTDKDSEIAFEAIGVIRDNLYVVEEIVMKYYDK